MGNERLAGRKFDKGALKGSIIVFNNRGDKTYPTSEDGYNQRGVFISDSDLVFLKGRHVIKIDIDELRGTNVLIARVANDNLTINLKIAAFFKRTVDNYRLFDCGIRALMNNNFALFDAYDIMPHFSTYSSDTEYERAWGRLLTKLQKGDSIFTFNSKSLVSRMIARIDGGSWSHCGIYIGNGYIDESIPLHGSVIRPIDIYRHPYIHVGIYRFFRPIAEANIDSAINVLLRTQHGYGHFKAVLLGMKTLLGLDNKRWSTFVTPNGIIYQGMMRLVDYI